jgi:membrane protease YdiL (CAAX protease family)
MTRNSWMVLWGVIWAALAAPLLIFVLMAVTGLGPILIYGLLLQHLSPYFLPTLAAAFCIYNFPVCFSLLPGARPKPDQPVRLGPLNAAWAIACFIMMQLSGNLLPVGALVLEEIAFKVLHIPMHINMHSHALPFIAVMAGELVDCLWVVWFLRRLGLPKLTDGSAVGIAWRPASRQAYSTAAGVSIGILAMVAGLTRLFPPNMKALEGTTLDQLAHGPLWTMPFLLLLIVFLGPMLEEMLFRGIMFAGIASRWGTGWAVALTTIVFVALHAPEKIHYPPGFIDVGLAALAVSWLRLRFNSIKPGMLLHILYNGGSMVVLGLMK